MSKQIKIGKETYDSRSVILSPERLKLPNHPRVSATAIPAPGKSSVTILMNIPFSVGYTKTITLTSDSPKRIDAIRKVEMQLKQLPMYHRVVDNTKVICTKKEK